MAGRGGRDQRAPMERIVRLASVLKAAGADGVSADKLARAGEYPGDAALDQLSRDLRHLRDQGWQIDNVAPEGEAARYRMVTVDNRLRIRLTPAQQAALQRAVLLADRADLGERLGLSAVERPPDVDAVMRSHGTDERLSTVMRAVRERSLLEFRYGGKERCVHPESVRSQNERWYLRGMEDGGDVLKTFVVSRMSNVEAKAAGTARAIDAAPTLALHPMGFRVDPPTEVTLLTTREHRPDVERWLGTAVRGEDGADSVTMTYEVTNRAAMRCRLYELGPRVRIAGPDAFRDELIAGLVAAVGED